MADLTCGPVESLGEWRGVLRLAEGTMLAIGDGDTRVVLARLLYSALNHEVHVLSARGHRGRWILVEWEDGDGRGTETG